MNPRRARRGRRSAPAAVGLPAALTYPSTATAQDVTAASVTVRPDPTYQQPAFESWGTSLVRFANATGRLFDGAGQATGVGARVGVYTADSGSNQRWAVVDRAPRAD